MAVPTEVPAARVQLAGLIVPVEFVVKPIEPVGVDGLAVEVSMTVAVQLVGFPT
jgi:hypothetical protein